MLSHLFQAKFVEALLDMIGKRKTGSHTKALRESEILRLAQRFANEIGILTKTFRNSFPLVLTMISCSI